MPTSEPTSPQNSLEAENQAWDFWVDGKNTSQKTAVKPFLCQLLSKFVNRKSKNLDQYNDTSTKPVSSYSENVGLNMGAQYEYIHMASQNISVKQEAYDFLRALKGKDKSFSEVILEFKGCNREITRFFGVLKDKDWRKAEAEMKSLRKEFEERLK